MGTLRVIMCTALLLTLLLSGQAASAPVPAGDGPGARGASASSMRLAAGTASWADARDLLSAHSALGRLQAKYKGLEDVTVRFGITPGGAQAVAYYTTGEIIVYRDHTATIEEILAHEVWHIIDWRDDGALDWGESLPPLDTGVYERRPDSTVVEATG